MSREQDAGTAPGQEPRSEARLDYIVDADGERWFQDIYGDWTHERSGESWSRHHPVAQVCREILRRDIAALSARLAASGERERGEADEAFLDEWARRLHVNLGDIDGASEAVHRDEMAFLGRFAAALRSRPAPERPETGEGLLTPWERERVEQFVVEDGSALNQFWAERLLAAYNAALRSRPAPDAGEAGWRESSTAPRDGSHILVADFARHGFGRCGGKLQHWSAVVHWWPNPGEEGFYLSSGGADTPQVTFTHWTPLEAAPALSPERERLVRGENDTPARATTDVADESAK